jgi:GTPase SAR1 family protein
MFYLEGWVSELREKVNNDCQIILVGNKCDVMKR